MTTPDLPWIVLVSAARSGTTHLIRMMKGIKDLHVVKEEWLNDTHVTWAEPDQLRLFSKAMGREVRSHLDPRLTEWVRADKARALHILQSNARRGDRAAMTKLFKNFVTDQEFHDLFLSDPRSCFVILKRCPIDCYISLCKAIALNEWVNNDTTGLRVVLDADHFAAWHTDISEWFAGVEAMLEAAGRPYGRLDYDADIAQGNKHMLNRAVEELDRAGFPTRRKFGYLTELALRKAGPKRLGGSDDPRFGARKQDRAASPTEKVSNWAEFLARVEAQPGGLQRLESFSLPAS